MCGVIIFTDPYFLSLFAAAAARAWYGRLVVVVFTVRRCCSEEIGPGTLFEYCRCLEMFGTASICSPMNPARIINSIIAFVKVVKTV